MAHLSVETLSIIDGGLNKLMTEIEDSITISISEEGVEHNEVDNELDKRWEEAMLLLSQKLDNYS